MLAAAALCFALAGCGAPQREPPRDYSVLVASDLHYLAPELTDHGPLFREIMENGDGKVTEYCVEITDAFLSEVIEAKPDALILTGDLSFNGARASHLSLAERLRAVEEAGVPVFVLPGNHDLYRSSCAAYFGESSEPVPGVNGEEFREIYGDFGFAEALSADADSLSYVAELNESTRLVMLDANTFHDFCGLSDRTLSWLELQLAAAEEQGKQVLAACHQNLFQHSMFRGGYVLTCSETLHELLERYHVPVFLSGHMHIQHILSRGTVTEIASSPLTMGACLYGRLQKNGERIDYAARSVDVVSWAAREGREEEDLLRFPDYALEALSRRTRAQAEAQLRGGDYSPQQAGRMVNYACALNLGYFTGDLSGIPALDPEGELLKAWEENGSMFGSYFASFQPDFGKNFRLWSKPSTD